MTVSPIKKLVIPSIVLFASIFSALTLPLVVFGSEKVVIQLKSEPLFEGKIKDIAAPYLGFTTIFSIGAALSFAAVFGWRQSLHKSGQIKDELSKVKQELKDTEIQVAKLKVSESQLKFSGLDNFLLDDDTENQSQNSAISVNTDSTNSHTSIQIVTPLSMVFQPLENKSINFSINSELITENTREFLPVSIPLLSGFSPSIQPLITKEIPMAPILAEDLQYSFPQMIEKMENIITKIQNIEKVIQNIPPIPRQDNVVAVNYKSNLTRMPSRNSDKKSRQRQRQSKFVS